MPRRPPLPLDQILVGDSIARLKELPGASIHLIASDIPYGIGADDWDVLHANTNKAYLGKSPAQKKAGAVFARRGKPINGWSQADRAIPHQFEAWCASWAGEWVRVLKPGGSAFVFAGRRFGHRCVAAMEDAGFSLKDVLAWTRERAAHRAQRLSVVFARRNDRAAAKAWEGWRVGNLRPSFEPVFWLVKPYRIGATLADNALEHGIGPYNARAFADYVPNADNLLALGFENGEGGLHPTQKPVRLMAALIELASRKGQIVLDPFAGSGSTLVAARELGRHFIGIEREAKFVKLCEARLGDEHRPR